MNSPAIRYHGGKFRLAPWVLSFFPEHVRYVEPFGGGAGVLLQKKRSYAEVYNDLDGDIVNFFRVLRDPEKCARLIEACTLTPFARQEFELAFEDGLVVDGEPPELDDVERARRIAVRASMGFGSAGASKNVTGFRVDTRRSYGTAQHIWQRYPATLAAIGERLTGVLIENRPAVEVLAQHDGEEVLHYCDPPYVLSTRDVRASRAVRRGQGYYRHEMSDEDHVALLLYLNTLKGMVVVSGYANPIYDQHLRGWEKHTTLSRISSGRGADTREESLWMNEACSRALRRPRSQRGFELES